MRQTLQLALIALGSLLMTNQGVAHDQAIPIKILENHLILAEGYVGNATRLHFLVDTGGRTILDRKLVDNLHLRAVPSQMHVIDADLQAAEVSVPLIGIGPVQQHNFRADVLDLTHLTSELGTRIDALIGLDLLSGHSFRVEYIAQRIVFGAIPKNQTAIAFQKHGSFVVLPAELGGQTLDLLLDTGTFGLVLFRERGLKTPSATGELTGSNLAGHFKVSEIGVPRLRLGKAEFQMPAAFFTDDRRMNDYAFDGLLGVSAACVREISVDFDNDLFSWKPRGSNLKCDGAYARLLKSAP